MTWIGSFTDREIPEPLTYQFLDNDGAPIDLTGFTATFHLSIGGTAFDLDASVTDDEEGIVTHVWLEGEMTRQNGRGGLRCEFAVTNGTNSYDSTRLRGFVRAAIREPAPTP